MSEAKFTHGSLTRHVVVTSSSMSLGLLAVFAVDFVDMFFIAMLGNPALAAAVGYAAVVLFFTTSISIGLSIAAGALVGRALGADDKDEARAYASSVIALALLVSVAVAALALSVMPWLLSLLGAQGETKGLALTYLNIITPFFPIMSVAFIAIAVLRAYGDSQLAMYATIAGGVVNAALDPLFIFTFDWGLAGAAWATVASRFCFLIAALLPLLRKHKACAGLSWALLKSHASSIVGLAIPAVLTNLATPIGTAIVTREMARFGSDAVAGMAIISRLTPLAFAMVFALSGAVGPIVAQNFGARAYARVRSTFTASVRVVVVYVVTVSLLLFLLRAPLAELFSAEGETRELLYLFCGPLALAFIFNGVIFAGNAVFNNIGHPLYSTYVNWGRHTLGTWPLVVAGASLGGAAGVLIGQALGGVIFAVAVLWLSPRLIEADKKRQGQTHFLPHVQWHLLFARMHK